jgi:hypothetical protein
VQVSDCLGILVKTFKTHFLPFFDVLSMYLTPMLVTEMINCRIWSLCAASIRAMSIKYYIILDFYSQDHVLVIWKWIFRWLISLNNVTIFLLIFHIFRARIKQQKKEGSPFVFLMMLMSTVGKQQLGNSLRFHYKTIFLWLSYIFCDI